MAMTAAAGAPATLPVLHEDRMSCHLAQLENEPSPASRSSNRIPRDEDEGVNSPSRARFNPSMYDPGLQGQREVNKFDRGCVRPPASNSSRRGEVAPARHRAALAAPTGKPDDPGAVLRRDLLAVIR